MGNGSNPAFPPLNLSLFPTLPGDNPIPHHHHDNTTTTTNEVLVQADLNPRLPMGVLVGVLMVVGVLGNGFVLHVYQCRMPRTVFSTFVTVLAGLDLTTALVGMPIDLVIKSVLLGGSSPYLHNLCRVAHFEVYSTSLASGSVLLLIAVTRYSKVCRPMQPGLSKAQARRLCLLIVVVSMSVCSVTFLINGMEKVRLAVGERERDPTPTTPGLAANATDQLGATTVGTATDGSAVGGVEGSGNASVWAGGEDVSGNASRVVMEVVEVYICRTDVERKGTALYYAMQAVLMTAFVAIFLSLIVLHWRISVAVAQFERRQSTMRRISVYSGGDPHGPSHHITAGMFRIFATITVIFVVSYLPHLVCLIVEKSMFHDQGETMPTGTRAVMDLAYNFPYINVVANPFIYGYRSVEFRQHCLLLLRRLCCWCCCCCGRRRRWW